MDNQKSTEIYSSETLISQRFRVRRTFGTLRPAERPGKVWGHDCLVLRKSFLILELYQALERPAVFAVKCRNIEEYSMSPVFVSLKTLDT